MYDAMLLWTVIVALTVAFLNARGAVESRLWCGPLRRRVLAAVRRRFKARWAVTGATHPCPI